MNLHLPGGKVLTNIEFKHIAHSPLDLINGLVIPLPAQQSLSKVVIPYITMGGLTRHQHITLTLLPYFLSINKETAIDEAGNMASLLEDEFKK